MVARICLDCPQTISAKSKGRCRPCAARRVNADPVTAERRNAAVRAAYQRPDVRAGAAERGRRAAAAWRATPEGRARLQEIGRAWQRKSQTPEAQAKRRSVAKAAGAKKTETCLGWCPVAWRSRYKSLRAWKGAAEARRLVELEILGPTLTELRAAGVPERQITALLAGAQFSERRTMQRVEHSFTLGGVSAGMLA